MHAAGPGVSPDLKCGQYNNRAAGLHTLGNVFLWPRLDELMSWLGVYRPSSGGGCSGGVGVAIVISSLIKRQTTY